MSEIKKSIEYCLQNRKWTICVIGATIIGLSIGAYFFFFHSLLAFTLMSCFNISSRFTLFQTEQVRHGASA